jgi:hypothetical protein
VDNRPTVLIADMIAKAPPDGHTLLVTGSAHWIGPLVERLAKALKTAGVGVQ